MSKFTAPTGESPLDERVAEVRHQLGSMRQALVLLRDQTELDGEAVGGQTGKVLTELRHLIRLAMETEKAFEDRRKAKEGIVNTYRLDLDDARATIRRRLDRLRAAEHAGHVPGRVDGK